MAYIADEISSAIAAAGVHASLSKELTSERVHDALRRQYTDGSLNGELWEIVKNDVSVRNAEAWRWPAEYARGKRTLLTFDSSRESAVFVFEDGADIEAVLAETTGFEFYVTDPEFSYMLCFNHHEYLIAAGEAVGWLRHRIADAGATN